MADLLLVKDKLEWLTHEGKVILRLCNMRHWQDDIGKGKSQDTSGGAYVTKGINRSLPLNIAEGKCEKYCNT